MKGQTLKVDIRAYWHPGGGRGQGMVLDASAHRASNGLPVLPGRHLKGLLREALEFADGWGWDGYHLLAAELFGQRTENMQVGEAPNAGYLRVTDACISDHVAAYLTSSAGRSLIKGLFRTIYATAVNHDTGTSKDKSLRGIEVVVPLKLTARIDPINDYVVPRVDWQEMLSDVLPLITAVGAYRTRGLGRAVLSLGSTSWKHNH